MSAPLFKQIKVLYYFVLLLCMNNVQDLLLHLSALRLVVFREQLLIIYTRFLIITISGEN